MLAFLTTCASKGVILVTPCRVILNVLTISATLDAILKGVLFGSILMTPSRRFKIFVNTSTTPMDRLPVQTIALCFLIYRIVENF